jgi:universal stress protein E
MTAAMHLMAATDLSAPARHAAERAASVAAQTGASLDLVHVAAPAPLETLRRLVSPVPEGLEDRWQHAARERLDALAAALRAQHRLQVDVELATGAVPTELARLAADRRADLLVLGSRGDGFMRHVLLGSTAERLLRQVGRPMLVVKRAPRGPYRSVLVPVDLSDASLPALRLARAFAPQAELAVLNAFEAPFEGQLRFGGVDPDLLDRYRIAARREALEGVRALCEAAGLRPETTRSIVQHGSAVVRILEQEQEQDADLVVVARRGAGALESMLLGSVSRELLARTECDVLVAP